MIDSKVIAHRFGAGLAPESTLAAMNKSLELGVRWVEFDASLLKDGTVIVFHDDTFDRCTNATGPLCEQDWQSVQKMDAGSWFDPTFKGEGVLELGQALQELNEKGICINLEIKVNADEQIKLVESVLALTNKFWSRPDDLIYSSFNHSALLHLRKLDQKANIGHLFEGVPPNWRVQTEAVSALTVHADADVITPEQIHEIKAANYPLYAYTVNDFQQAQDLFNLGVDGVFTDFPNHFPVSDF